MTSPSTSELIQFLAKHQFLPLPVVEGLNKELNRFPSAELLTDDLIQRGLLTHYQQTHLLCGQGEKLVLGPYRILDPLGEGGMGLVYKGWHPRLDRYVALKLIRPQVLAARPDIVTRFHREARAIAQLNHPNVVILYDAEECYGTHYLAMEFVDGITLEKMVRQSGPLAIRQACDYMRQAALGLQHAQECGLVHRDIKPSNILVATKPTAPRRSSSMLRRPTLVTMRDKQLSLDAGGKNGFGSWGLIKILDMGLARLAESLDGEATLTPLTKAGALLGTPDFIAPEQARDATKVDIRADLYSLGCTFYYILTGRPPFQGGTDVQKLIRHQSEEPFPIEELRSHIPGPVADIVRKLLAKQPKDRYAMPQDLANVLTDYMGSGLAKASTPTPEPGNTLATIIPLVEPEGVALAVEPPPSDESVDIGAAPPIDRATASTTGKSRTNTSRVEKSRAGVSRTGMSRANGSRDTLRPISAMPTAHNGVVAAVALSPTCRWAASGGVDGRAHVWDLADGHLRESAFLPRPQAELQSMVFHTEDPFVVVGGTQHGAVRVWRWDWTEGRVFDWGAFPNEKRGVNAMTFSPDGRMFSAAISNVAAVWKVNRNSFYGRTLLKGHQHPLRALAFSPDRRLLATAGEGRTLRFWRFGWFGPTSKSTIDAHADIITAVAFSPDGRRLVTGGLDRNLILWDPQHMDLDNAIPLAGHNGSIKLTRFLPDSERVISVGENGQVIVWDALSGAILLDIYLETPLLYSVDVSANGRWVIGGTTDGKLLFFDLEPAPTQRTKNIPTIANTVA